MYLSNIVVCVCDLRHVEALTGVRTLVFTTVTFITNRAPRPPWGRGEMPTAHPLFRDVQREALITKTRNSVHISKCARTHFIPCVEITLVRIFSRTSLGDPFKSGCFPVSWLWYKPEASE